MGRAGVILFFQAQKWCGSSWECWMLGTSIDEHNRWKCELTKGNCLWKQRNHYPWSCLYVGNFICVSLEHFNRQYEHASDCRQIHALLAEWEAEEKLCQDGPAPWREAWKEIQNSFWRQWQVICKFYGYDPETKQHLSY